MFKEEIKLFQQETLVKNAIEQGIDLREYSKQIQQDLKQIEIESIDDYLSEAERLADLHLQLRSCGSVLEVSNINSLIANNTGSDAKSYDSENGANAFHFPE